MRRPEAALSISPFQPLLINQPVSRESCGAKCQMLAALPSAQYSRPSNTALQTLGCLRGLWFAFLNQALQFYGLAGLFRYGLLRSISNQNPLPIFFHNDCSGGVILSGCPINWFSWELRLWKPGGTHPCVRWPHFLEETKSKWVSLSSVFLVNVFLTVEREAVWSSAACHSLP